MSEDTSRVPENIDEIEDMDDAKAMLEYLAESTQEKAEDSRDALSEGDVNPSHMAHAEAQGMAEAYSAAYKIVSYLDSVMDGAARNGCPECGSNQVRVDEDEQVEACFACDTLFSKPGDSDD
jgi:hypothetical protein